MIQQPMFSIGNELICINSQPSLQGVSSKLLEGRKYEVKSMRQCKCGNIFVDVGLKMKTPRVKFTCSKCGEESIQNRMWKDQDRFILASIDNQINTFLQDVLK